VFDKVLWQEEEVQWGDFVEYDVVLKSGALSIDRLLQGNKWPGSDSDAIEVVNDIGDLGLCSRWSSCMDCVESVVAIKGIKEGIFLLGPI
jgi:hypothetical protein